uniref:BURP domain-containing protein n=1 Tax=Kalanchoe fedtschenkoi TaxID=63787 RepID=A0A7N0T7U6_KALFE
MIKQFTFSLPDPLLVVVLCFVCSVSDVAGESPFTPKAAVMRYWTKEIRNGLAQPEFLLSKASPMSAVEAARFGKLADQNGISAALPAFCAAGKLLCFPDLGQSLEKHESDVGFKGYTLQNFTNYGTDRLGGIDSFKNYSDGVNIPNDSFRRYSRDSVGHRDSFAGYATDANVVDQSFNTYGTGATGGSGNFQSYNSEANVPNLKFTSYSTEGNGRSQSFGSYSDNSNSGDQKFASYGKHGNGSPNTFTSYGKDSNVIGSGFSGYGEAGNGAENTFTSYGVDGNVPENHFQNYGAGANGEIDTFTTYRDQSNVGDDTFQSYEKNSNSAKAKFSNYGKSFNEGSSRFTGYGEGAKSHSVGFTGYGVNTTFKDYAKKGVTFAQYTNSSTAKITAMEAGEKKVNRWVEPGKFFRESALKTGVVIPMPDIRDKMPKRAFLPRTILSKLPFSSSKLDQMKQIFHAADNSTMEKIISDGLSECERAPSKDETKRCVGSIEDMIDFATSVLGRNIAVRTTESVAGSKQDLVIGALTKINGGRVTKSVSCHQSLFPYLLYYCHSVPKVRVYEADLLDPKTKSNVNHGVAICHLDTSAWSPTHGSFLALGSGPGKIEVCHWIFENDMTWTISD